MLVESRGFRLKDLERVDRVGLFAHILPDGGYTMDVRGEGELVQFFVKMFVSNGAEGDRPSQSKLLYAPPIMRLPPFRNLQAIHEAFAIQARVARHIRNDGDAALVNGHYSWATTPP